MPFFQELPGIIAKRSLADSTDEGFRIFTSLLSKPNLLDESRLNKNMDSMKYDREKEKLFYARGLNLKMLSNGDKRPIARLGFSYGNIKK